jgi:hypothetical protein
VDNVVERYNRRFNVKHKEVWWVAEQIQEGW